MSTQSALNVKCARCDYPLFNHNLGKCYGHSFNGDGEEDNCPCRDFVEAGTGGDTMSHKFETFVEAVGFGSKILVDGVEVPMVRSFTVHAHVDGASLQIECLPPVEAQGFVDAITWFGGLYLALDGNSKPLMSFMTQEEAEKHLSVLGIVNGRVELVPCRVTR